MIYTLVFAKSFMADLRSLNLDDAMQVMNNAMALARDPHPIPNVSTVKDMPGGELYAMFVEGVVVVYDIVEPSTVHLLGVERAQ